MDNNRNRNHSLISPSDDPCLNQYDSELIQRGFSLGKGLNESKKKYIQLIRELPRPTPEQTALFAEYVSEAHSWYKHLPLRPKVPFFFYLDPHAGQSLDRADTGERSYSDITEESDRFHYNWRTTEDYRKRFGFWDYAVPYGISSQLPVDGGAIDTAGADLKFLFQGEWLLIPASFEDAGKAYVSALVHPSPSTSFWYYNPERFGLTNPEESLLAFVQGEDENFLEGKYQAPKELDLEEAMARERIRQLEGMKQAMNRFVEAVLG